MTVICPHLGCPGFAQLAPKPYAVKKMKGLLRILLWVFAAIGAALVVLWLIYIGTLVIGPRLTAPISPAPSSGDLASFPR